MEMFPAEEPQNEALECSLVSKNIILNQPNDGICLVCYRQNLVLNEVLKKC